MGKLCASLWGRSFLGLGFPSSPATMFPFHSIFGVHLWSPLPSRLTTFILPHPITSPVLKAESAAGAVPPYWETMCHEKLFIQMWQGGCRRWLGSYKSESQLGGKGLRITALRHVGYDMDTTEYQDNKKQVLNHIWTLSASKPHQM